MYLDPRMTLFSQIHKCLLVGASNSEAQPDCVRCLNGRPPSLHKEGDGQPKCGVVKAMGSLVFLSLSLSLSLSLALPLLVYACMCVCVGSFDFSVPFALT